MEQLACGGGVLECAADGITCSCVCMYDQAKFVHFYYDKSGCMYNQKALDIIVFLGEILNVVAFVSCVSVLLCEGRAGFKRIRKDKDTSSTTIWRCLSLTRRRNVSLVFLSLATFALSIYGVMFEVRQSSFYVGYDAWATILITSGLVFFWLFVNCVTLFQVEVL
jgi:hypothetical protein